MMWVGVVDDIDSFFLLITDMKKPAGSINPTGFFCLFTQ